MKELCLLLLICWAGTLQCLAGSLRGKIPGKPQECKQAEFVPGYNLAGEGFDIVKMQRKGSYVIDMENWEREGDTCELGVNFYLGGVKQKLPAAMANWRALTDCKREVSSSIYESSESLINTTTSAVTNNWKLGLDLEMKGVKFNTIIGGTDSREATYVIAKSKQDRYSFTRHEVHCSIYRYSLVEDPPLHKQFLNSVKKLPTVYDLNSKPAYRNLIDTYGTHFTSQVNLGGKVSAVTSIKSCQATMNGLTITAVKDCLDVEASLSYQFIASLTAELHYCNELKKKLGTNQSFNSMFSDRHSEIKGGVVNGGDLLFSGALGAKAYKEWLESLKTIPDVVHYSLKPLHFLLKSEHPAQPGLKKAVEEYILENALIKKCSGSCQIGTRTSKRDHCACVCNSDQSIKSNCCPAGKGLARLQVYRLRAKGLYGDILTKTDGFVEISYDKQVKLTEVIKDHLQLPAPIEMAASLRVPWKICSILFFYVLFLTSVPRVILGFITYSREELLNIRLTSTHHRSYQEYDFPETDPVFCLQHNTVATRTDSCVLCVRLGGGCVVLTSTRCSRGLTCQSTCYLPITGMPGMF
ncbi:perforin-1 isoform X2 [Salvelinus sp. IW2-2015]